MNISVEVKLEVVNTIKEFKWRLTKGNEHSEWTKYYEGILKHTFSDGSNWYVAMSYWEGKFPIEQPFQLVNNQ